MKKLLLLLAVATMAACSSDDNDCSGSRDEINERYDGYVQQAMTGATGPDYAQVNLLNIERAKLLANACY